MVVAKIEIVIPFPEHGQAGTMKDVVEMVGRLEADLIHLFGPGAAEVNLTIGNRRMKGEG